MSNVPQPPPNASTVPDLTFLITILQEITQNLLNYIQACQANEQEQSEQHLDTQKTHPAAPPLSNQAKRRECHKEFCYDHADSRAFADKEIAQFFTQEYKRGNFRDEIRYYYVPSHIVCFEHKLLKEHQEKDVLNLLSNVFNELDFRSKLIAYIDKDKDQQDLSLAQIVESIFPLLKMLQSIHAHLSSFNLIHKRMLPRRNKG